MYFLQVDFNYHDEFYNFHFDYPSTGEKIEIKKQVLSNYNLQIIEDNNSSLGKNKNLISNLSNTKIETAPLKCKTLSKCRMAIKKNHRKLEFK